MRYYEPVMEFGPLCPTKNTLIDRIGGLPWGIDPARWPRCKSCGGTQTHLAQFVHHPDRLDLGATGRVLTLFQCAHRPGICPTWEMNSGANACLILEPDQVGAGLTHPPSGTPIELDANIIGWVLKDDGIPVEEYGDFFNDEAWTRLDEDVIDRIPEGTKLGGVPAWGQSAEGGPPPPWRFALQLSSAIEFHGPAPAADQIGVGVSYRVGDTYRNQFPKKARPGSTTRGILVEDDDWFVETADFGESGTAYVFVRTDQGSPDAVMFWQSI